MIKLEQLEKIYRKPDQPEVRALNGVSLDIKAGEFIAILGPSGSGKSTLMNMIGLLDRPDSGTYRFNGQDMFACRDDALAAFRNKTIGFVFQSFHLLPRTTALENVQLPLLYSAGGNVRRKSQAALDAVGLADRAGHFTHELSGGQQQRVAIARALVNEPDVILADEPTGNLDSASEAGILDLFRRINRSGRTVIFITHNEAIARTAGRLITIRDGRITSDREQAQTIEETLES